MELQICRLVVYRSLISRFYRLSLCTYDVFHSYTNYQRCLYLSVGQTLLNSGQCNVLPQLMCVGLYNKVTCRKRPGKWSGTSTCGSSQQEAQPSVLLFAHTPVLYVLPQVSWELRGSGCRPIELMRCQGKVCCHTGIMCYLLLWVAQGNVQKALGFETGATTTSSPANLFIFEILKTFAMIFFLPLRCV